MGKKKSKEYSKKQKKKYDLRNYKSNDDGFMHLEYTSSGKKKMDKIRQKMSAKVFKEDEPMIYNPKELSKALNDVEEFCKDGKYKKANKACDMDLIAEFIDNYNTIENKDNPNWEKMNAIAKRILSIGKSFYEYSDIEFLKNSKYDELLAKFLSFDDAVEPLGIIPKGSKFQQKTGIKYDTLHNNMDKAYVLNEGDPYPDGVKERDTVESFLWRAYKALKLESNDELQLELSPKIDGVSLNGTIVGNTLREPQTRGDSEESIVILGLDNTVITKHDEGETFGIQFELFVTEEDRIKASEYLKLDTPYVSCRHAASGITHRLSTMEDSKLIDYISLYPINSEGLDGTYLERMDYLANFGIVPKDMPKRKVVKDDLKGLLKKINKYYNNLLEDRPNLSFAIDGMVITVADDEAQETIGRNGRTNKFQIAYKFDPSKTFGIVKDIHLDIGKKGYRTIQVDLKEPVYLDGIKYDHIPVPTASMFETLHLCKDDRIEIHRVGDVIPSFTVDKRNGGKTIPDPTVCPACNKPLRIHKKRYYCDNFSCPGNVEGRFVNFFEKLGMNGYSNAFCRMLIDDLHCTTFTDILDLTPESIKNAGVTSKQAMGFPEELRDTISKKYGYEVLGAMGIPGIATEKARFIMDKISNNVNAIADQEFLYSLIEEAVGSNQAQAVFNYVTTDDFIRDAKTFNKIIVKKPVGDKTKRIKVGHTGTVLYDETKEICEANGFEITDGSNFDILIANDLMADTAKMKKAKKKNIPIYLQWQFVSRYNIKAMDPNQSISQLKEFKLWQFVADSIDPIKYVIQILEAVALTVIKAIGEKSDDKKDLFDLKDV